MSIQFNPEESRCTERQITIVSRDKGNPRMHKAYNRETEPYYVRHYKLDGELVKQEKCCDFLLLNDSLKVAYLIELKGRNIGDAIPQLENAKKICQSELKGYTFLYRIVCSKVNTHDIHMSKFRKFKDKYGSKLLYKTNLIKEYL